MRYEGSVFRPPSEAYSLIVQATIGCSHNKCTFCSMYKDKQFRIRKTEEIIEDLQMARDRYSHIKKIFLADGDALAVKFEDLKKIMMVIKALFPECERVGIYGSPKAILTKSEEELEELKTLGLGIVYLGVESGSANILKNINKGVDRETMIKAGRRIVESSIDLSITLISGIGGKKNTEEHAIESAKIINEINPNYVGLLTLIVEPNTPLYTQLQNGEIELLSPAEVLLETKTLVENLEVTDCVFRSNHASNYVALKGTLPAEKSIILNQIEEGLQISGLEAKDLYRRL